MFIYLFIYLCIYLFIHSFIYLLILLFCYFVVLFIYLCIYLCMYHMLWFLFACVVMFILICYCQCNYLPSGGRPRSLPGGSAPLRQFSPQCSVRRSSAKRWPIKKNYETMWDSSPSWSSQVQRDKIYLNWIIWTFHCDWKTRCPTVRHSSFQGCLPHCVSFNCLVWPSQYLICCIQLVICHISGWVCRDLWAKILPFSCMILGATGRWSPAVGPVFMV